MYTVFYMVDCKIKSTTGKKKIERLICSESITVQMRKLRSVQFSSVSQSCPTLRDPMNRSTPGLPVHHQLAEFTQTHAH